jgi:hypothetical protein
MDQSSSACCENACGPSIGNDFLTCGSRGQGWVGGADALFFKPFSNDRATQGIPVVAAGGNTIANAMPGAPGFNYQASPRVWFGYVNCSGLGIRGRIFDYYTTASQTQTTLPANPGGSLDEMDVLKLRTFDLELTQEAEFRYWSFTTFGGLRYGQTFGQSNTSTVVPAGSFIAAPGTYLGTTTNTFYGVGLTGGLQAERVLTGNGMWSFFVNGRGSVLLGNERQNFEASVVGGAVAAVNNNRVINNTYLSIWELSCGPQWNYVTAKGARLSVRMGFETQFWQNFAPFNTTDTIGNFALGGFSIGGQLTR